MFSKVKFSMNRKHNNAANCGLWENSLNSITLIFCLIYMYAYIYLNIYIYIHLNECIYYIHIYSKQCIISLLLSDILTLENYIYSQQHFLMNFEIISYALRISSYENRFSMYIYINMYRY